MGLLLMLLLAWCAWAGGSVCHNTTPLLVGAAWLMAGAQLCCAASAVVVVSRTARQVLYKGFS